MSEQLFLEPDTLPIVDRSTLENASECPRMSRFLETGRVLSTRQCMESGSEAHKAIGETIDEYVASQGQMGVSDLSDFLLQRAAGSRPDIQPDVLRALKFSAWSIAKFLNGIHYLNVLRWDGGRDEHSGQLAYDFADLGVRVTSEVDLIYATSCPEVIAETDFKTGFDKWLPSRVGDSFQFQVHALLLFKNYPNVNAIETSIWNTRTGSRTYPTLFERKNLYNLDFRVHETAAEWLKTQGKAAEECEPWPMVEKCSDCPAAHLCDCTKLPQETPEEIVTKMVGLEAQLEGLTKLAADHVRRTGQDILVNGSAFGFSRVKRSVKPKAELYSVKAKEETESTETGEQ